MIWTDGVMKLAVMIGIMKMSLIPSVLPEGITGPAQELQCHITTMKNTSIVMIIPENSTGLIRMTTDT